jgi:prolyl-tRNA editing enzyme YbaK/EbsC (Cys-tRNA(Pro) deacylase)
MGYFAAYLEEDKGENAKNMPEATEISLDRVPASVKRVVELAMREGIPYSLRLLPGRNLSPAEIAQSCGVDLEPLAQSIVLKGKTTKKPMVLIASAATKMNERALAQIVGEVVTSASAEETMRVAGFDAASMPPLGHANRLPILMDQTLGKFARIWCMAGEPDLIMSVPTMVLARVIAARMIKLD